MYCLAGRSSVRLDKEAGLVLVLLESAPLPGSHTAADSVVFGFTTLARDVYVPPGQLCPLKPKEQWRCLFPEW